MNGSGDQMTQKSTKLGATLLCLVLAGCYSDQKQQLAVCRVEIDKQMDSLATETVNERLFISSARITLCMATKGYEVVKLTAPECVGGSSLNEAMNQYAQALSARCYAPMSWVARRVFDIERKLGNVD